MKAFTKIILTGLISLALPSGTCFAASAAKEIKYKSNDLNRIKDEMTRKKEEQERLKKKADVLSSSVKEDQIKIRDVEHALLNTRRRQAEVQQDMAITKNQHDALVKKLSERKSALYDSVQTYAVASILQGPHGLVPIYSKEVIRARALETKQVKEESAQKNESLQSLIETQSVLRREADRQQGDLGGYKSSRQDKEKQLSKTMSRQEIIDAELRELKQTAEQLASLIEILRTKVKKEEAAEKKAREQKALSGESPILPRSLPWPSDGKITTKFGRQQHPTLNTPYISNGIVLESSDPSDVEVVADGKVLFCGEFMGYGGTAIVEHAGDWYSVYARLVDLRFDKGQSVTKGDVAGVSRPKVGGGTEMYFELRFYGKATNPMPWMVPR